jgi:hypothetical protein
MEKRRIFERSGRAGSGDAVGVLAAASVQAMAGGTMRLKASLAYRRQ